MNKNLTIVVVDTAFHALSKRAIEETIKVTDCENILVLSDQDILPGSNWIKIDPIDTIEFSRIMFKDLAKYITTDYFMSIHYDGFPTDSTYWDDEYLKYDYIGAPWSWGPANRRVGNGGFSLRTRRLAEECAKDELVFNPPGHGDTNYMEDTHICLMYRDHLESKGIKYPEVDLATKFSAEFPGGKFPTYGFHGTFCLPYYLTDDHMEYYIDNMSARMLDNTSQQKIVFGLYLAQRYDHLEHIMDRGSELVPDFKNKLLKLLEIHNNQFPNLSVQELEQVLINY